MKLTKKELIELENQLSCPKGEIGIAVGKNMDDSNMGMTLNTIQFLELKKGYSVLELGHGNCGHLEKLLEIEDGIQYYGLEISETMYHDAMKQNSKFKAEFRLYDGERIPYEDNFFDRTMSVNSIYFWSNPIMLINEIERTLKLNGICVISFGEKEFMKKLPFVGNKFKLYDIEEMQNLIKHSNLKIIDFKHNTEFVKSKTGEEVKRSYTMVKFSKMGNDKN